MSRNQMESLSESMTFLVLTYIHIPRKVFEKKVRSFFICGMMVRFGYENIIDDKNYNNNSVNIFQ